VIHTAVVFVDPQNEVLSDKELARGALGDGVRENKTVEKWNGSSKPWTNTQFGSLKQNALP
jgi:hypothetical protein